MPGKSISLFMWGYQIHYRIGLKSLAERVFETLGLQVKLEALLVGARRPGNQNRNPVCVEPEDGQWSLDLFTGLLDAVENAIRAHPLQDMYYGDEPSMREKPENIRRDSVRREVKNALAIYDTQHEVRSFCGSAYPVGDHYVVPAIQVPEYVFKRFPPLNEPLGDGRFVVHASFIHAAMAVLLEEATAELQRPDPGRSSGRRMRTAEEIVRHAAKHFMATPGVAIKDPNSYLDLFEPFNVISSLMYEGAKGTGRLLLARPDNPAIDYALRLAVPVPFRDPRWARKILQMASAEITLIADCEKIYGLGKLQSHHDPARQDAFTIDFLEHYHWQIRCGTQVLLQSQYGEPKLPQQLIGRERFVENFARLFPQSSLDDQQRIWSLLNVAIQQDHGSMIVVASDAADETHRLALQGTVIKPAPMTDELFRRVSFIDGTIILDPHCVCHAIGVILDGPANDECVPSRGSRFNSGIRYVRATDKSRMAIVVSDDHTTDIIPLLRPRIDRDEINRTIAALEIATLDNYHQPRNWLDEHRFYLNTEQCQRVNIALDRIENEPKDVGQFVIITRRLKPHPEMNDDYYIA